MNPSKRLIAHRRLRDQLISEPRFTNPADTVAHLGAVQAQEYLSALWAVGLRTRDATEASIEQAIAERALVRTWPMRGTIHFVHPADVRWMLALLTPRVVAAAASRFRELELDVSLFARSRILFARALEGGKQLTRGEMYQALEQNGISVAGQRGYHLLWRAAQDGLICFGSRRGKRPTFVLLDEWAPAGRALTQDEALAELARRYFTGHGPATLQDFVWWSGLTVTDARAGLEMVRTQLAEDRIEGRAYWSSLDAASAADPSPSAWLLPNFDEYLVGYRERSAVLDPVHAKQAAPGGGMLNATVVLDGQVVGVWKRTLKRDRVLLEVAPVAGFDTSAVAAAADRYAHFVNMPVEWQSGSLP